MGIPERSRESVDDPVVELIDPLRRYVRARSAAATDVDDVVQESLARILERRKTLTADSLLAYAIVVARNVMADEYRQSAQARRAGHRVIDLTQSRGPEDEAVLAERDQALRSALDALPAGQRETLLAHVVDERPLTALAAEGETTSGNLAAQLARSRAKVRLDYLLALRRVDLPTDRCRPVLLALSAGDKRRQAALRAGHHLLSCATCAELGEPLLERRRVLAAFVPWIAFLLPGSWAARVSPPSPVQAGAMAVTGLVAGAAVVTAVVLVPGGDVPAGPGPGPSSAAAASSPAARVVALDGTSLPSAQRLAAMIGDEVTASDLPVSAVPADEGFWVGTGDGRLWVEITTSGRESPAKVEAGDIVSFTGRVRAHGEGFATAVGVSDAEGGRQLVAQKVHLTVESRLLEVEAPRP